MEKRLKAYEERLAATLSNITDAVITTDTDGNIIFANPPALSLFALPYDKIIGRQLPGLCDISPGLESDNTEPMTWDRIISLGNNTTSVIMAAAAGRRQMEMSVTSLSAHDPMPAGWTLVFNDITERRQALTALRQSEHKYRSMLEAMHDMVYICDAGNRLEYLNPAMIRRLGRNAIGEMCHKAIYDRNSICPWCPREKLEMGRRIEREMINPADNRVSRIFRAAIPNHNRPPSHMMIVADITTSKLAERALQESEARYKRLVASVTDYIYSVKINNGQVTSTFHGPGCIAVTGYSTADYAADPDLWFKMVHVEDRKKVLEQARQLLDGNAGAPLEHRINHKSGEIRWVRNTAVIHRDHDGLVSSYDGLVSNITERKQAEFKINEHARKLEIINRIIIAINKAADMTVALEQVLEYTLDLLGFHGGCIFLVNDLDRTIEMRCARGLPVDYITSMSRLTPGNRYYREVMADGQPLFAGNYRETAPTESIRGYFGTLARLPLIAKDKIIGILIVTDSHPHEFNEDERDLLRSIAWQIGTALDKSKSETELRDSEQRYRTITEQSLVGVQIVKDNRLVFINDAWSEITGYSRFDVRTWTEREFINIVHPHDQHSFAELLRDTSDSTPHKVYDYRFFSKSGAVKWMSLHSRSVVFMQGPAVMAIIVDITDRKNVEQALGAANRRLKAREEQLRAINQELYFANEQLKANSNRLTAANREKEVLLKEIHHRVKNNLQIVSSLLKLQTAKLKDKNARQIILECQNQIKSIAIVHEKLYQSPNLADIKISEHIGSLVKHLFRTFLIDPESIKMNIVVADVAIGIDKAIPCSLIINELVSNSLKYAFVKTGVGNITIRLQAQSEYHFILEISDDGCGFSNEIDFRNTTTLGLQLVMTFVEQLGGNIKMERGAGTHFAITFDAEPSRRILPGQTDARK